jgi:hypothetical protein
MVTPNISLSPQNTQFSMVFPIINNACLSHKFTTGPFGLLYDMVWRDFINMSEEILPIYLANMLAEDFSETLIRNYETLRRWKREK